MGEKSKSKKNKCPAAYYRTWKLFCRFTCKQVYYSFGHLAVFHILFCLVLDIFLNFLCILSFCIYVVSSVSEKSAPIRILCDLWMYALPQTVRKLIRACAFCTVFNDFLPFIKVVLLFICLFFVQFDSRILVFRRSPRGFSCRKSQFLYKYFALCAFLYNVSRIFIGYDLF